MIKIFYLHGIGSGANSNTAQQLKEYFSGKDVKVFSPELPAMPKDAFCFITEQIQREKPHIVIGTSLGGFYAQYLRGPFKILVNPAMRYTDIIRAVGFGEKPFFSPRQNGEKTYTVDECFIGQLKEISEANDPLLDSASREGTYALFGTRDTVVSNYGLFKERFYEAQAKQIDAEHRLSNQNIALDLIPLVEYLMRERLGGL